jgi:type 1 glutamine amidotransferase
MIRSALMFAVVFSLATVASAAGPIKALLITGGCCHDYGGQKEILTKGISARANVEWTVIHEGGKGTKHQVSIYKDKDWAKKYDIVVHNECFAGERDLEHIKVITEGHKAGVPAVMIHCAMHTYRKADIDDWRKLLGVTSRRHQHKSKYEVRNVAKDHPIMKGFPATYTMPLDELYVIEKLWPNTRVLATSPSEKDGKLHPVFWTSEYGKARVFGTTYGHSNATFSDEQFLNVLTRGIQWAATSKSAKAKPTAVK